MLIITWVFWLLVLVKVEQALPFFKTALEANPNIAQYWLSYIDALIKLDRMADAKAVLNKPKVKAQRGRALIKIKKVKHEDKFKQKL